MYIFQKDTKNTENKDAFGKAVTAVNMDFPRILTLLRKERGLSQKQAAADLGVSQALLSHYEKGIRQCGLEFVVRVAEYYAVSTDYLLGRTPQRSGATISVEELPEQETLQQEARQGTMLPILQKKLMSNTLQVISALLQECSNRQLTTELSAYLSISIYKAFRLLYSANHKNPQGMFSISPKRYEGLADAAAILAWNDARSLANGESVGNARGVVSGKIPNLSPEILSEQYPQFSTALFHFLQATEERLEGLQGERGI